MSITIVTPSNEERADIIRLSLLGATVAMGKLMSSHPSLLDRNIHLVFRLKHILHLVNQNSRLEIRNS
jgi:hypothetical protein